MFPRWSLDKTTIGSGMVSSAPASIMVVSGLRVLSHNLGRAGRFITSYNKRMSEEDAILEEAMDNLRESIQRLRAIQNRLTLRD